jgi:Domain of unknown function (DUF2017)
VGPGESEDAEKIAEEIMAGFRRTARGVSARFSAAQAGIVRALVGQIAELVAEHGESDAPGVTSADPADAEEPAAGPPLPGDLAAMLGPEGPVSPPDDPVLARLFPDGYNSDPEAAGEFRKYTEQGLRSGKIAAAETVLSTLPRTGGRVRLSPEDGEAWLRALNDVRLALGVRLGITEEYEHELARSGDDPRPAYLQVYDWLTYLQETLVQALWAGS